MKRIRKRWWQRKCKCKRGNIGGKKDRDRINYPRCWTKRGRVGERGKWKSKKKQDLYMNVLDLT